jgi:hypothetical protein
MLASGLTLQTGAGRLTRTGGEFCTTFLGLCLFVGSLLTPGMVARLSNIPCWSTSSRQRTHNRLVDPRSTNDGSNWTVPGETSGAPLV